MALQLPPFVGVLLVGTAVAVLIGRFAWRHRDQPGAASLTVLMAAIAWWSLTYAVALVSTSLSVKLLASKATYFGIVIVPVAWLAFAVRYTGRGHRLTRRRLGLLLVVPAVTVAMVWTTGSHGLHWSEVGLTSQGALVVMTTSYGSWFWVHTLYSYVLLLAGAALILQMVVLSDHLYRWQAVALLVAVVLPMAGNALFISGLTGVWDTTTVGFVLSGGVLVSAMFRQQLLDVFPIAREVARDEVIESMADAVVVVDDRGRVVDLNPAAAGMVDQPLRACIGTPVGEVLPELAPAFDAAPDRVDGRLEFSLEGDGATQHIDARVTPLRRGYGALRGHLVIMRDVTQRERHRQRLEVLNRLLRHDLRNDMNVLLGHVEDLIDDPESVDRRARRIREKALDITELSRKARVLERTIEEGTGVGDRVDVAGLVDRAVSGARRDHPEVDLRADVPDAAVVRASGLIGSAVENLLRNAIDHNDSAEPSVHVSVERRPEDGVVDVRFADNGPGIPDAERAVLERGGETPLQHSSGLGLWLVHWIVTESDGEIAFAENEPRGTVVTISLEAADDVETTP